MIQASAWVTVSNYVELDGLLVPSGRRLLDLSSEELLSYGYSWLVRNLNSEERSRAHAMMLGEMSADGRVRLDDPLAPEELQGQFVPSFWTDEPSPVPPGL